MNVLAYNPHRDVRQLPSGIFEFFTFRFEPGKGHPAGYYYGQLNERLAEKNQHTGQNQVNFDSVLVKVNDQMPEGNQFIEEALGMTIDGRFFLSFEKWPGKKDWLLCVKAESIIAARYAILSDADMKALMDGRRPLEET